jgi:hypothetical protein
LKEGLLEIDDLHVKKAADKIVGHPVVGNKFDVVVSSNIFSQLLVQLKNSIQKDRRMRNEVGGMAIFFGEELLLAQHLEFLRQHLKSTGEVLFFLDAPKAIVDQHVELMISRFATFGIQIPNTVKPWVMLREMNEKWAWMANFS